MAIGGRMKIDMMNAGIAAPQVIDCPEIVV
jgi:hypothetical protein